MAVGKLVSPAREYRSLVRFDTSSIPPDAVVTSAKLRIRSRPPAVFTSAQTVAPHPVSVHHVTSMWDVWRFDGVSWVFRSHNGQGSDGLRWTTRGGDFESQAVAAASVPSHSLNLAAEWEVKASVQRWVSDTSPNFGLLLQSAASSGGIDLCAGGWQCSSGIPKPQLQVTYQIPADNAAPGVDAAGDIVDLADDYTNGQSSVPVVVMADDDRRGIAHVGISQAGGAELGGVDVDCGTPRRCPTDTDEGFDVNLSSLGAGKRVLQATARDDVGKIGVSESWTVYVDRQAPGLATGINATKVTGQTTQIYWTEPEDPTLPDGNPGSGTTDFSYRYRINLGAWSSWASADVPGVNVPSAAVGSTIDVQVSSIDAVGNAGAAATATVTVTAEDTSGSAESGEPTLASSSALAASADEVYVPGSNKPATAMVCSVAPGLGQTRFGRGQFDLQNGMRVFNFIRCWNNAKDPKTEARVLKTRIRYRLCLRVPRTAPLLPIELRCRTTWVRASLTPGNYRDTPIRVFRDLCVAGNRQYMVNVDGRVVGPLEDKLGPPFNMLFQTAWDCNEAGAWRYIASRGSGSASAQLGRNITAPQCSGERCDALPAHGSSGPRRGWQAHHVVPGGEGRNYENNTTAQASRAQTYAYSCNARPNGPPNGAWLRGSDLRYPKTGYLVLDDAERKRPVHSKIHTIGYYQAIADRLDPYVNADDTCANNDGALNELQEIKREVIAGAFEGLPAGSKEP